MGRKSNDKQDNYEQDHNNPSKNWWQGNYWKMLKIWIGRSVYNKFSGNWNSNYQETSQKVWGRLEWSTYVMSLAAHRFVSLVAHGNVPKLKFLISNIT